MGDALFARSHQLCTRMSKDLVLMCNGTNVVRSPPSLPPPRSSFHSINSDLKFSDVRFLLLCVPFGRGGPFIRFVLAAGGLI